MKELDLLFKTVIEGMRGMAKGIEVLADKLDTLSKSKFNEIAKGKVKQKSNAAAKAKAKAKKPHAKQAADKKPATAIDIVYAIIKKSQKGVNTSTLMEKTGFDRKKVSNIIYKLKNQGKIKSVEKGIYLKV